MTNFQYVLNRVYKIEYDILIILLLLLIPSWALAIVLRDCRRIRGLNSLPPGELQELLYARRFELLGPLNTSPRKGGKWLQQAINK